MDYTKLLELLAVNEQYTITIHIMTWNQIESKHNFHDMDTKDNVSKVCWLFSQRNKDEGP